MKLITIFTCGLLLGAAAGCGSSKPAPSPSPPATTAGGAPSSASPSTTATKEEPPPPSAGTKTNPTEIPPPPSPNDLSSLAARLIEKDPQGGWRISESAALELEKRGENVNSELVALLSSSQAEVRRGAAFYLLARFDAKDIKQVEGYSGLLEDSEPFLRTLGLQAVRKMQRSDQIAAVPRLAGMLSPKQEASAENRATLARLLGNLKQEAAPALAALSTGAAEDDSPKVRGACLVAISQIAPAEEGLPAFRAALADKDPSVRLVAAARLRLLGKKAAPAADDLGPALEDVDPSIREAAAEALVLIGKGGVESICKHLESGRPQTRQLALACLGKIGPDARPALPLVKKRLADEDPDVKRIAAAVAKILQGE